MVKNTSKPQIWHKIIRKLNEAQLDYVIVGAAALVIHGLPRSTLDIDVYIPARGDTLTGVFTIAKALGLKSEQEAILKVSHLPKLFAGQWICFSYKGQDVLDVFFEDEGAFNKLYRNAELKTDKDISVRVASLDDLVGMKQASGRPIDKADLCLIEEARKIIKGKK